MNFRQEGRRGWVVFFSGASSLGHTMLMCLITGDGNLNHLVKEVSARFPPKVTVCPFVSIKCLERRYFRTM